MHSKHKGRKKGLFHSQIKIKIAGDKENLGMTKVMHFFSISVESNKQKRNKNKAKSMRTWKKYGEDHRPEESQDNHSHAANQEQAHHPKFL